MRKLIVTVALAAAVVFYTIPEPKRPTAALPSPLIEPTSLAVPEPAPIKPLPLAAVTAVVPTLKGYADHIFKVSPRADMHLTPAPLKAFILKVQKLCGPVTVVSAYRPGSRVRGSGRVSLHASGKAIDYQIQDIACALRQARDWPGGHSTDYRKVNHFHASYAPGSGEWKRRFAHYTPRKHRKVRYAKHWRRARG